MVIVHLSGGLGNQLFSYAFGLAVAEERGDTLAIDTAIQDAKWFFRNPDILHMDIQYHKRITYNMGQRSWERGPLNKLRFSKAIGFGTKELKEKTVDELGVWSQPFVELIHKEKHIYVRGNWGSEKYFKPVADMVKQRFVFIEELSNGAKLLRDEIRSLPNSVTLHYRRGDYVKLGISPTPDYFIEAMKMIEKKVKNPVFYCFSEDNEWIKNQFRELPFDIRYPTYESNNKGIEDFRLLSAGKHQIISNSSYSWWAAYLNKQVDMVVIPCNEVWTPDFGLESWIKLPFQTTGRNEID